MQNQEGIDFPMCKLCGAGCNLRHIRLEKCTRKRAEKSICTSELLNTLLATLDRLPPIENDLEGDGYSELAQQIPAFASSLRASAPEFVPGACGVDS